MTLTTGLIIGIIVFVLFVAVLSSVAEGLVKIAAKQEGEDPRNYGVLPNDLKSLFMSGTTRPAFIPEEDNFISLNAGFDIKLVGEAMMEPGEEIEEVHSATYALKPKDFIGMMPIPKVIPAEGDDLKAGDPLFYDKKRPDVKYAAPVSGEMLRIQRGEKRSINEVVILADKEMKYRSYDLPDLEEVTYEDLTTFLLGSGAWPFIRQRPHDIVADHTVAPKAIFVTTFDTAPLAPSFELTIKGREKEFQKGLDVLNKLTEGAVYVGLNANNPETSDAFKNAEGVVRTWFKGPHPAGNVGVHMHHLNPVNPGGETVWHLDVHGVLVLGTLFEKGIFDTSRVVALTGADIEKPRYIRTYQGLCIERLLADVQTHEKITTTDEEGNKVEVDRKTVRIVSGDALTGKAIEAEGYLGFYDDQLTTIAEGDYYELFGWLIPQTGHPTQKRAFPGGLVSDASYIADTQQNGEYRAWVVSGEYESVLPMNIYPQHVLRAVKANDLEKMEGLGILELGEEDVALCEYVCTSKQPVQKILREGLDFLREQG